MRKSLRELSDIFKNKKEPEDVDLKAIDRANAERLKVLRYNAKIIKYLSSHKKPISEMTKQDIEELTKDLIEGDKYLFMKQVVKTLETEYGKPISWIKENHKSVLFD